MRFPMKIKVFTTATLFSLLLLPLAHAQVTTRLQGNIPFHFQVGETALPAGEYVVSRSPGSQATLRLRGSDRKTGAILIAASATLANNANKSAQNAKIVFHRYGDTYFLRQVWQGGGQNGN